MAEKLVEIKELKIERPERAKLSDKESLQRMREFEERKERFVASVREGENRSVSS